MDKRYFSTKVVEWYESNKRNLPWREVKEPYNIWLSEIILQQTRVAQGLPYYERFIKKFPEVSQLAAASEHEVLRLWQGLGYYTRARNLHKCAKEIATKLNGVFPDSYSGLKELPGVGDYTAAAIASFSFKEPVAVVDGNVFRVLARIFGIETEINSPNGKKIFTTLANELIDRQKPDLHNQAVMEFGALHCTPKNPACSSCVFLKTCFAAQNNMQAMLPVKTKAKTARKRYFYYLVFKNRNAFYMKKREEKDIWQGLYDFPLIEKKKNISTKKLLSETFPDQHSFEESGVYKHVLTHQVIMAKFILMKNPEKTFLKNNRFTSFSIDQIKDLPKPVLISKFLEDSNLL